MQEIILTGYDKKAFDRMLIADSDGGCYFCKRDEHGVFLMPEGEELKGGCIELRFAWYPIVDDKRILS